jgi:VanZ family protein
VPNPIRSTVLWFCFFYSVFVIYGSFVPFQFNDVSFELAVQQFLALPFLDFTIVNRSDWFTNFLLLIPLSYGLVFVLPSTKNIIHLIFKLLFLLTLLISLSVAIEFIQMFLGERVSSFKDVFAQFLGILTGYLVFYFSHQVVSRKLVDLIEGRPQDKWISYASVILVIFTLYNLMPLDLSVSPVEIYKKWVNGRINIVPFQSGSDPLIGYWFGIISDAGIWALIAVLYLKGNQYTHQKILLKCVLVAFIVELMQLFVLSRYSDITDVITAAIGAFMAIKLFPYFAAKNPLSVSVVEKTDFQKILSTELSLILWCLLLAFFAIYPAELIASKTEFVNKWHGFFSVPLETYWRGNSFSAITQLLRKVVLAIPLGLLITAVTFKHQIHKKFYIFPALFGFSYMLGLELIQLILSNKVSVLSDVLLNVGGLYLGFVMYVKHNKIADLKITQKTFIAIYPFRLSISLISLFICLLFVAEFDGTPYNVKELFGQNNSIFSAALIVIVVFFAFGFPKKGVEILLNTDKLNLTWLTVSSVLHSFILFNLVYMTFPYESLYDILGFPVWQSWPNYLELAYRFMGFYWFISAAFFIVASRLVESNSIAVKSSSLAFIVLYIIIILPISFVVVVVQAGTDNLVELMRNDGYSFRLLLIVAYFFMLIRISLGWLPQHRPQKTFNLFTMLILTLVSSPLAYVMVSGGVQDLIIKYGQVFSTLQFLLSPSRNQLLAEPQVLQIFIFLHFAMVLMIYAVNWALAASTDHKGEDLFVK